MSPFISATSSRRCPVTDCPQLLISEHHLALQIRNLRAAFPRQSIGDYFRPLPTDLAS